MKAAIVTERDEPQAVIGSTFHRIAFPEYFREHVERRSTCSNTRTSIPARTSARTSRGRFASPRCSTCRRAASTCTRRAGKGGCACSISRLSTTKRSPSGSPPRRFLRSVSSFTFETRYATAVAAPTTIAPDPTRVQKPENREQPIHAMYGYIFVVDRYEGLILVPAGTLLDGNPLNNYLRRELTFNPDGILCGAREHHDCRYFRLYLLRCGAGCCRARRSQAAVRFQRDRSRCAAQTGGGSGAVPLRVRLRRGRAQSARRDRTLPAARPVAALPLAEAHNVYVARTYAYVAGGKQGLIIVDVTNPEAPFVDQVYNAGGCINDLHDVKLGSRTPASLRTWRMESNGMRIVQLTSPETPGNMGFSPRPTPVLIATRKIPKDGHALAISEGVDRDRAVDESGNQIAVFGRLVRGRWILGTAANVSARRAALDGVGRSV